MADRGVAYQDHLGVRRPADAACAQVADDLVDGRRLRGAGQQGAQRAAAAADAQLVDREGRQPVLGHVPLVGVALGPVGQVPVRAVVGGAVQEELDRGRPAAAGYAQLALHGHGQEWHGRHRHRGAVAAADVGTTSSAATTAQPVNKDVANVRGERILEDLLKVGDSEGSTVLRGTPVPGSPDRYLRRDIRGIFFAKRTSHRWPNFAISSRSPVNGSRLFAKLLPFERLGEKRSVQWLPTTPTRCGGAST
jgi:hypothetical protein